MNILFISRFPPVGINGGIERIMEVLLPLMGKQYSNVYSLSISGKVENIRNHFCLAGKDYKDYIEQIQRIVSEKRIDFVIVHLAYDYLLFSIILRIKNVEIIIQHHYCIYTSRDVLRNSIDSIRCHKSIKSFIKILFFVPYNIFLNIKNLAYFYLLIKISVKFIVLAENYAKDIKKQFCLLSKNDIKKITVINNPLTLPQDSGVSLSEKENIILFVGRLSENNKNIVELLRIWKIVQEDPNMIHHCFTLHLLGDGPDREYLKEYIAKRKIINVFFEGRQDPVRYYKKAKILCLTSREGWGLVITEAMQYKVIPVCYDSYGALHDIIIDNENGFLIKNKDKNAYSARVIDICVNYAKYHELAEKAASTVKKFNPIKIANDWSAFFSTLYCK
jgi:glycosyltransferase involved in cell wall biosynthesis